jgi:hypothetical protein
MKPEPPKIVATFVAMNPLRFRPEISHESAAWQQGELLTTGTRLEFKEVLTTETQSSDFGREPLALSWPAIGGPKATPHQVASFSVSLCLCGDSCF